MAAALEEGQHKKSWLPLDERFCGHCTTGEVETEVHFLLKCDKYRDVRTEYFQRFNLLTPDFFMLDENNKLCILLGEGHAAQLAAQCVTACYRIRDT